jgi:hypothetical protein
VNKIKIKKAIAFILQLVFVLTIAMTAIQLTAFAKSSLPMSDKTVEIYKSSLPAPAKDATGQDIVRDLTAGALRYVKPLIAVVGILYATVYGYILVVKGNEEEEVTNAKKGVTFTIIAFVMISMAEDIGKIFDMQQHTLLESPQEILKRVRLFDRQVEIMITFIKYILGAFATFQISMSAYNLILAGGNEEATGKHKKSIGFSLGGLVLLYVGDIAINRVFFKVNRDVYTGITGVQAGVDAQAGVEELSGIVNFVVSFVGPLAILMLLAGAVMYLTSGGEDEKVQKAKRLITATIIGIILIYGAFALVSTVISGKLAEFGA